MDSNRMRKLFLFGAFILFMTGVSAQQDSLKYRISLKDKAATEYSLKRPEKFLSEKAIERRKKQNLPIDSTDFPVCRKYIDEIRKQGVNIVVVGKWDNFVTVSCNDTTLIDRIAALPLYVLRKRYGFLPVLINRQCQRNGIL